MLVFIFPVLGGLSGLLFLRILGFRKFAGGDLLLGSIIFLLSIIIQSPIQQLPIIHLALSTGIISSVTNLGRLPEIQENIIKVIVAQGMFFILALSIWLGYIAALVQSGFKYIFVRNKSYTISMNIGAGFGLIEAFYIGINGYLTQLFTSGLTDLPMYYYTISGLERFSAFLFHVGSTLYIYDALKKGKRLLGFLLIVMLHGFMDSLAALYQFTGSFLILIIAEIVVLLAGLLLTLRLYKNAIIESEEEILW